MKVSAPEKKPSLLKIDDSTLDNRHLLRNSFKDLQVSVLSPSSVQSDEKNIMNLYSTSQKTIDNNSYSNEYLIKKNFITPKVWLRDQKSQQAYALSHQSPPIDVQNQDGSITQLDRESASIVLADNKDWNEQKYQLVIKQKKDKKIGMIVDCLKLNNTAKRKVAYTMRNTLNDNHQMINTHYKSNLEGGTQILSDSKERLPKMRTKDLAKQIQEMKLKKIEKFTKAYVKDYTVFNYKIDSVLNEAYGFVKNHNR
ncbi:UNKNOWN [Stylonychia lemnae]|uniref:Uncharacterized protein n=1 Tax=Stylonychia lemnae TaxID=5949 RepID=A0A078AG44_STYLE|nr:UNKNOWN [Stylonychia lemnae]|eukprot:CDW79843.1 UNKNOWN [Stylonychia lemnae]